MTVIGIDLGTTYCAAARFINGEVETIPFGSENTFPSVVGVSHSGKPVYGWPAKNNQARNPQDTIVEVKRKMGEIEKVRLGQQEFLPQEISSMILKEIVKQAQAAIGEDVTGAVITCPAYFKEPQRNATKEAGELAGLNVLRVLNEPTAAATAYGVAAKDDEENLCLVYDLGGGTFDVTVISMAGGNLEVIGTGGDPYLGGGNFDDRIVDWIFEHLEKIPGYADTLTEEKRSALYMRLKVEAEKAKIKLCGGNTPPMGAYQFQLARVDTFEGKPVSFTETLTMEEFEKRIDDLVKNSLKWIDVALEVPKVEHKYTEADITDILLVGGSSRVPLVRKTLEARFPDTPIRGVESGINPDEIVAAGAALIAAQVDPDMEEIPDAGDIQDVTGHTLSVLVRDAQTDQDYLHGLIHKDTLIPCGAHHRFATAGKLTPLAMIKVYQGEGNKPDDEDTTLVGEFEIRFDPIEDSIPLDIGLELNEDGILYGRARNEITTQEVRCALQYGGVTRKSREEVQRIRAELEARLKSGVGRTANPLEEGQPGDEAAGPASFVGMQGDSSTGPGPRPTGPIPAPPGGASPQSAPGSQPEVPQPEAAVDPRAVMNPILRALYDQAIGNFGQIPAEKRADVMRLVTEIEDAAKQGDQTKMMQFYDPLNAILSSTG